MWWAITPGLLPPQPSSPPALSSPLIIPNPHMERHLIGTKQKDDRNLYIEQTSWRKIFQRQLYWQALRQATYVPQREKSFSLTDPQAIEQELITIQFTIESEGTLALILGYQQQVFERYKATFYTTPYYLRTWLNS
jgi:hypothetical protein